MTRSDHSPIGKSGRGAEVLNLLTEALKPPGEALKSTRERMADAWRQTTRAPSTRCEADGHRYQVVGRHKPTEVRCGELGCGAGPWMVGGAR